MARTDRLVRALDCLVAALREPDVLPFDERVTLVLSFEAGRRLEAFLLANPPPELRYAVNNWGGEVDRDTDDPKRFIKLANVRVMWPIGRVALARGGSMPRPWPNTSVRVGPREVPRMVHRDIRS